MEDNQIVDLYWSRSHLAIQASIQKYGGYCQTIAMNILGDRRDAEECVNDTWLGAWNAMPTQRPARLGAFLGAITRNLACTAYRERHAEKRGGGQLPLLLEELTECLPSPGGPEQALEDREVERAVNDFLRTLPEKDCAIFLRRYWYAQALEEIAGGCRLPVGTVKTSLFRTRKKLRRYLEKEGIPV